jgi:hypothetical protein
LMIRSRECVGKTAFEPSGLLQSQTGLLKAPVLLPHCTGVVQGDQLSLATIPLSSLSRTA